MDLSKLIENKIKEIQEIRQRMEASKAGIKSTEGQFPPLWSGDVRELGKFATDIEEWVKSPKVKHARELVETLRKQASDNRSFAGLAEDYLS